MPGFLHTFALASWVLHTREKGLAELEASGSNEFRSFWKADTSNRPVAVVPAFVRSLVSRQHLALPLVSPSPSFSSETEREDSEGQQSKATTEGGGLMACPSWGLLLRPWSSQGRRECASVSGVWSPLTVPFCLRAWVPHPSQPCPQEERF